MTLGQKIKKLRNEKGLTQKDLADQLHVTFQTVSKWESDTNEPDIATLKEIAKCFDCSVNDLLNDEEVTKEKSNEQTSETNKEETKEPQVIIKKDLHVCEKCKKDIEEDDLTFENSYRTVRHGRTSSREFAGQHFYHKECLAQVQKERELAAERLKDEHASHAKKVCFGWGIAAGVVGLGIALGVFLTHTEYVHPALGVLYSVLIGYGLFSMLYCILSGSYIGDVFVWCATRSVRFPGLIFSWDLGGFAWLIGMKILFAIIGFLVGVFALLFAIALSAALGGISFPFVLVHNIHTKYEDAF